MSRRRATRTFAIARPRHVPAHAGSAGTGAAHCLPHSLAALLLTPATLIIIGT